MTMHGDQGASQGVVARNHLIDGLAGDAGCIEADLPTNCDRGHATGTGHINVQKSTKRRQTDRRLDGIEEAVQS